MNKLDEQVYAFYRSSIERKAFMPPRLDVKLMRAASDMTFNDRKEILPIWKTQDVEISGPLRLRVYTPHEGNTFPVLLFFHGGGFIMHNIESHDALCRKLAVTLGFAVVSVGYRLAPEHPYPAALEDAEAACRWVRSHAAENGWNADRIYAGGDSAGATISAALALKLAGSAAAREPSDTAAALGQSDTAAVREPSDSAVALGQPDTAAAVGQSDTAALSGLLLLYGVYGAVDLVDSKSCREFGGGDFVLPQEMLEFCDRLYAGSADRIDSLLYPGLATDFSGFPPCVVVTADFDPLRDDGLAFADKVERAGIPVTRIRAEGMMHGFALHWHRFRRAEATLLQACSALTRD